jgi:hypothetical protein
VHRDERYLHSPESWTKLWKQTFADLEGEEFVEKSLKVDVETQDHRQNGLVVLYWSVEIV